MNSVTFVISALPTSFCPDVKGVMVSYNSTCFDVISSRVDNYTTAQAQCASNNGTLAEVILEEEFNFIRWQLSELKIKNRIWVDSMYPYNNDSIGE